ncbi:DUF3313 domain-containing protein [Phenylobacterium sp.]|jgi:hypothetical protein|uniref:DUF3313 domain-containing protein n=1 Tax=Phenylobacterium sp. TaxID=1871053 RepID=UPI0025F45B8F|nr:DUF3313 domain-containing protein [Phenylobacterium sp.]|tara:strand:+ start:9435 stop:10247 length:813 start_codon:yes stop_codon:yes gene_type:complete
MPHSLPRLAAPALLLALAACAGAPQQGEFLSSYEGLAPRTDMVRAGALDRTDANALAGVTAVRIEPTVFAPRAEAKAWMTPAEQTALLREVDAQLCFELSERFEIAATAAPQVPRVRAAVTEVVPTGRAGSAASAAAGFFIPGPIGVRVPGALGGLGAEAEMLDPQGQQVAAIVWRRTATAIGTDNPSLSRIGDALQFVEPFADAAAAAMTPEDHTARSITAETDPCREFGARFRVEGLGARFITGLYVPEASAARPAQAQPEPEPAAPR